MNKEILFSEALYQALKAIDECSGYANKLSDETISDVCNKAFSQIAGAIAHFESHVANVEYDDMGQPTGKFKLINE